MVLYYSAGVCGDRPTQLYAPMLDLCTVRAYQSVAFLFLSVLSVCTYVYVFDSACYSLQYGWLQVINMSERLSCVKSSAIVSLTHSTLIKTTSTPFCIVCTLKLHWLEIISPVYRYKKKRKNGVKIVLQLVATYWNICHACCLYVVHAMHNTCTNTFWSGISDLFVLTTYLLKSFPTLPSPWPKC